MFANQNSCDVCTVHCNQWPTLYDFIIFFFCITLYFKIYKITYIYRNRSFIMCFRFIKKMMRLFLLVCDCNHPIFVTPLVLPMNQLVARSDKKKILDAATDYNCVNAKTSD